MKTTKIYSRSLLLVVLTVSWAAAVPLQNQQDTQEAQFNAELLEFLENNRELMEEIYPEIVKEATDVYMMVDQDVLLQLLKKRLGEISSQEEQGQSQQEGQDLHKKQQVIKDVQFSADIKEFLENNPEIMDEMYPEIVKEATDIYLTVNQGALLQLLKKRLGENEQEQQSQQEGQDQLEKRQTNHKESLNRQKRDFRMKFGLQISRSNDDFLINKHMWRNGNRCCGRRRRNFKFNLNMRIHSSWDRHSSCCGYNHKHSFDFEMGLNIEGK